ncbi:MAG: class I SAM-dependent methyltransferase, partial [Bacteroidales bacterium]|nr:class I SAM-dependent methyltransferase [Bacteroidales bacterium]
IGRQKVQALGLSEIIQLEQGDSEAIAYPDNSFDAVGVAFGVRNYENLELGLREMLRVLKPGGMLLVLELSVPQGRFLYALYSFYFTRILPWIGGLISGDKQAYAYLPASVLRFPKPGDFLKILQSCGYIETRQQTLSLGLARIFTGKK